MRTTVLIAALVAGLVTATPANSAPECVDIGPGTRMCNRGPGHTAITTTPIPIDPYHLNGFGFGTPVFGLGGGGIWLGF